jgi:hypothetical protein
MPWSISWPVPAFDVLAAATMKPCEAMWRSSPSYHDGAVIVPLPQMMTGCRAQPWEPRLLGL